ncbi:MAG: hypothetical protein VX740_11420 [Pseudomonadota bacterium]|nr:hypothetical protein [Pseudomonadota bacterium]
MKKLMIKQNLRQVLSVFIGILGACCAITHANAQSDLRQPLFDACKAQGRDETFCNCMIGEPYNAFLYNHQYGGRDKLIETQSEIRATILQEPTMTEGRIKEICAIAEMQFMPANEAPKESVQRIAQLSKSLKEEYPPGDAARMSIRNMIVGYCSYGPKIAAATKRAEKLGSFEAKSHDSRSIKNLYRAFLRDQRKACTP